MHRFRSNRSLAAIVALGAILRLYPIWFGLPDLGGRPDEGDALDHALQIVGGDFNPHFFHWPSLTFYAFAGVFVAVSDILHAVAPRVILRGVDYLLIARVCIALAGTATIAVLFHLTRRIADVWTGLAAATFLAVAVLHVRESHFAMTDVLMTLLATSCLALLMRAVDSTASRGDAFRWFAAAGFVGGLATSTKYSAAALLAAMVAAQFARSTSDPTRVGAMDRWLAFGISLAAFGCGFLVATPYAVLDRQAFAAALWFDFTHLSGGHAVNLGRGWWYHLTRSLPYGVGLTTYAAALVGIVPTVRQAGRRGIAIGAFALAFYAVIGSGLTVFFRYVLPLVPLLCLSAAVVVRQGAAWLASRMRLSVRAATITLVALIAGPPAANTVSFDRLLARTDTRVVAAEWLRSRLKPGEAFSEEGGIYARLALADAPPVYRWSFDPATGSFGDPDGRVPEWLIFEQSPVWIYASVPQALRRIAAERYELVYWVRASKTGPADSAVYDLQDAFFLPVAGFARIERPGPTVLIYRRRDLPPLL